jgi:hypothetical protein
VCERHNTLLVFMGYGIEPDNFEHRHEELYVAREPVLRELSLPETNELLVILSGSRSVSDPAGRASLLVQWKR